MRGWESQRMLIMDAGKQKNSNMKEKSNDIKAKRKRFTINLIGILEETRWEGKKKKYSKKKCLENFQTYWRFEYSDSSSTINHN